MFDIIFVSYNEPNADSNWERLIDRFPFAKRVHGVKGIQQAHIQAAKKCYTKMFWVIDGDSEILDTFNFDIPFDVRDTGAYVYRANNPINGLEYGNGGIKLLPRQLTVDMDTSSVDMTTSITRHFFPIDIVASVTRFNTDPFNTWKSAFRECVKLSSRVIDYQVDYETAQRLETWCTVKEDQPFSEWCIKGALDGREYGSANIGNQLAIAKINDFNWLEEKWKTLL